MDWITTFRNETAPLIAEPFWRCLAESIAAVESGWGREAIVAPGGLNEIGYKALPGHPSVRRGTREADQEGALSPAEAEFRLFTDRADQARALLHLFRTSAHYEAARLLFVLAFYAAYAPGREEGARALVAVFNRLAGSGAHPGVRPFALTLPYPDRSAAALNHAAARRAVRLFASLTGALATSPPLAQPL